MPLSSHASSESPASRSLWTRYFFPVQLFQEPTGDAFQQRAIQAANHAAARRWMPHYVRVHAVLALLLTLMLIGAARAQAPWWLCGLGALAEIGELLLWLGFVGLALATRFPLAPSRAR